MLIDYYNFDKDKIWTEFVFALDHKDPKYLKEFVEYEVPKLLDLIMSQKELDQEIKSLEKEIFGLEDKVSMLQTELDDME